MLVCLSNVHCNELSSNKELAIQEFWTTAASLLHDTQTAAKIQWLRNIIAGLCSSNRTKSNGSKQHCIANFARLKTDESSGSILHNKRVTTAQTDELLSIWRANNAERAKFCAGSSWLGANFEITSWKIFRWNFHQLKFKKQRSRILKHSLYYKVWKRYVCN